MKKVLLAAVVVLSSVMLVSCNSMERKAKRQLHETMEELAKNPETFKISKEKIVFSNDSMCTISFIGRGQNGFGGFSSSRMEYTLIKLNREDGAHYNESILVMDEDDQRKKSIKEAMENVDGCYLSGTEKKIYDECLRNFNGDKEKARADYLYSTALVNTISNGRIVDSDN